MTATPAMRDVGFCSERGPVLIALMLTTALIAIDATVVATAVPSIVADIGGFTSFPWLFSSYLLAQAVTVPIYAKVSDMVGRKPVILVGIGLFLLGSILCGFAWSMPALIGARLVQGLGAGAVQPMAITIAGDIYTVAERARVQGYLASVWAISSVLGPTLGGVFSSLGIWRAIFFVNIPVCLLAVWMLTRSFHESVDRQRHKVDVLGATLLTVALSLLLVALLEGGHSWAWGSPVGIAIVATGAVLLVLFVLAERRAAEPVLPAFVFTRPLLLTTTLIAFGVGAILLGLTSYVPTYLERVLGAEPIVAGLALAALTIGWPIAASLSGRIYLRLGFRPTNLIGIVLVITGTVGIALVVELSPATLLVAAGCFVVGLGLGLTSTPSIVAAQSSVEWAERGVVTGTNMFSRSVGSAFGVAVFGALANAVYARLGNHEPDAIAEASGTVFLAAVVVAVLTALAVLAMPRVRATPKTDTAPRGSRPLAEESGPSQRH